MCNSGEVLDLSNVSSVLDFARKYETRPAKDLPPMLGGIHLVMFARGVASANTVIEANYDICRRKADLAREEELKRLRNDKALLESRVTMLEAALRKLDRRILAIPINFADRRGR